MVDYTKLLKLLKDRRTTQPLDKAFGELEKRIQECQHTQGPGQDGDLRVAKPSALRQRWASLKNTYGVADPMTDREFWAPVARMAARMRERPLEAGMLFKMLEMALTCADYVGAKERRVDHSIVTDLIGLANSIATVVEEHPAAAYAPVLRQVIEDTRDKFAVPRDYIKTIKYAILHACTS